ncbi:MAG TPA: peptidoglycan DD-metalloendopeptidase family protein [Xanthobacteraceae bacterium]|nr:peptidoglycan DD-metalloendopeptidase family protein [Xanthobacteraceae bacterium]
MASRPPAVALLSALAVAAALGGRAPPAAAQAPLQITPPGATAPQPEDEKAARQRELEKLRADQKKAKEQEAKLAAELAAIGQDRQKLGKALIEAAARLREIEEQAGATESRLKSLDENEARLRASLDKRKAAIAGLLAALQRLGRHPPPPLLVRPEAALESVRAAILMGAVVPEMRLEAEALAADLTELVRVRREIAAERERFASEIASLGSERNRLERLVEERQKRQAEAEQALEAERRRALALARQVEDLKELIARLEHDAASAPGKPAGQAEPPRLKPAIAFAEAKGLLPLPVNGVKIRDFGAPDGLGGAQKGISLATRAGAQVTAPCDGWVVYAGPFRSYGQLLILNAGGGYHVLLAGMERISVDLGQFVLTGEPVAIMGGGSRTAATFATESSQPILYIEFRKDGAPVDPGPWWTKTDSEKVRG